MKIILEKKDIHSFIWGEDWVTINFKSPVHVNEGNRVEILLGEILEDKKRE